MRLSAKIFLFSVLFCGIAMATEFGMSHSASLLLEPVPVSETISSDDEVLFGSSCYVDITEAIIARHFIPRACDESDGSWTSDAPEGIFSNDHNDEQSTSPVYHLAILVVRPTITYAIPLQKMCQLIPGANYPPPQA